MKGCPVIIGENPLETICIVITPFMLIPSTEFNMPLLIFSIHNLYAFESLELRLGNVIIVAIFYL